LEIQCPGGREEIYRKVKARLEKMRSGQGKLSQQIKSMDFDDAASEAQLSGTGFKARVKCADGRVNVDLDLNFLLKPMRGQIEEAIRKKLAEALS